MAKVTKTVLFNALLVLIPIIYFGCDDAGVLVQSPPTNFSFSNLKPLATEENATYELFVSFDSTNGFSRHNYCSMGKFNVSSTTGQIVDWQGAAMNFKFNFSPDMSKAVDAIITIEPNPDNDTLPNGPILMGGIKTVINNQYQFNFYTQYNYALGLIAAQLLTDNAQFILASPTAGYPSMQYNKGVWFATDSTGNTQGITCAGLPDSLGWTYHAYLVDKRDTVNGIYNIGKFQNPGGYDDYNACNGSGTSWIKPGQDWIQTNCPGNGTHDIDGTPQYSLDNGFYKLLVTLEPKNRTVKTPFFFRIFEGNIPQGTMFNVATSLNNETAASTPRGDLTVSSNNTK